MLYKAITKHINLYTMSSLVSETNNLSVLHSTNSFDSNINQRHDTEYHDEKSKSKSVSKINTYSAKKRSVSLPNLDIYSYYEEDIVDINHIEYAMNNSKLNSTTSESTIPDFVTRLSNSSLSYGNQNTYSNIMNQVKSWFSHKHTISNSNNTTCSFSDNVYVTQGLCNDI